MPKELLPPEQFYASLATNYTSGLGFITDPTGDILLVKPNYRDGWDRFQLTFSPKAVA